MRLSVTFHILRTAHKSGRPLTPKRNYGLWLFAGWFPHIHVEKQGRGHRSIACVVQDITRPYLALYQRTSKPFRGPLVAIGLSFLVLLAHNAFACKEEKFAEIMQFLPFVELGTNVMT